MSTQDSAGKKTRKRLPSVPADADVRQALASLLFAWTQDQMGLFEGRQNVAEPPELPANDLRRLFSGFASGDDATMHKALLRAANMQSIPAPAYSDQTAEALRQHLGLWSKVAGDNVMRIFLGIESGASEIDVRDFLNGLKLSPNRAHTWRLIHPALHAGSLNMASFRQFLWVSNFDFINDCIHDLGRPLPIMELAELRKQIQNEDMFEATIQRILKPTELAYALSYGVFQLEVSDPASANFDQSRRMRLLINPLFCQSR